jgi:hypothetical protein
MMKNLTKVLLCASMILYINCIAHAKEWRGIVPLRSVRAEVEKLLGHASGGCKCTYSLEDANVSIVYSEGNCEDGGTGGWNIPPDTVIQFTVYPKIKPRFSEFKIDENKYKKTEDRELENVVYFSDEEEGFTIEVVNSVVTSFSYGPRAQDCNLRCSRAYIDKPRKRIDKLRRLHQSRRF